MLASGTIDGHLCVFALCDSSIIINNLTTLEEKALGGPSIQNAYADQLEVSFAQFRVQTLFSRQFVQFFNANSIAMSTEQIPSGQFVAHLEHKQCIFESLDFRSFQLVSPEMSLKCQYSQVKSTEDGFIVDGKVFTLGHSGAIERLQEHIKIQAQWQASIPQEVNSTLRDENDERSVSELGMARAARLLNLESCSEPRVYQVRCLFATSQRKHNKFARAELTLAFQELILRFAGQEIRFHPKRAVANLAFTELRYYTKFYKLLSDVQQTAQVWKIRRQLAQQNYTDIAENTSAPYEEFDYFKYNQLVVLKCEGQVEIACLLSSENDVRMILSCMLPSN